MTTTVKRRGRPREIPELIRREMVRLPGETRPPAELGDQWTVRTLARVFAVSPAFVGVAWKEGGFTPPLHIGQVEKYPNLMVPLRVEVDVPAWFRLHLDLFLAEEGRTLEEHVLGALLGPDGEEHFRDDILPTLRARWTTANEKLPRVDPKRPDYRHNLKKEQSDAR